MKKIIVSLLLGVAFFLSPISALADVWVNGYYRSNGTYVQGHYRSDPDGNPYNNYSYPGNTNPYTGKTAPGSSSTYLNNYYSNTSYPSYSPTTYTSSQTYPSFGISSYASSQSVIPALKGYVVYEDYGCDYFIAESNLGYALLEWYGGRSPMKNDKIYGNFDSYGFKNLYTGSVPSKTRVWVEDYMLSETTVVEKYLEKCN